MEVADDGGVEAALGEAFDDVGDSGCGVFVVDGDADDFRAGEGEGCDLLDGAGDVGRVGVGHGLDEDRDFPADAGVADFYCGGFSALDLRHGFSLPRVGVGRKKRTSVLVSCAIMDAPK